MPDVSEIKTLLQPSITRVFNEIKHYLYPSYRYLQGNCHCNAHLGSLLLKKYGIPHKKIWIFAPCRYSENTNTAFIVHDPNQIAPRGYIRWGYHVAPIIETGQQQLIFDFNFSAHAPMSLDTWLARMNARSFKCIIENPEYFLFYSVPSEANPKKSLFNGNFYPIEGVSLENQWFEKGLAANETAYTMYEEVIKTAIERKAPAELITEYKHLIGSINNFECVFRDNSTNKKMTLSFQEKHHDLIHYYRGVFEDNISKWHKFIQEIV
ncbi:protein-glutamine glutaminase family protein [Emticicia sp. 17c]|uniref:protein-glutamine glutaminase family protein n=1 Tax=Emticicia sp. 17c TaxID=3127704 RepID=UPI00301C8F1A